MSGALKSSPDHLNGRDDLLAVARCVSRALREELAVYPKPGLVSYVDPGSHPDMDTDCFENSIACLEPFFASMAEAGAGACTLFTLQQIGIAAEHAMLASTGGRNTQRGAIFCLGLLAAAVGRRSAGGFPSELSLGEIVRMSWGAELLLPNALPAMSCGTRMCHQHGISGVRGEAKSGFPLVYEIGLPALRETLSFASPSAAKVQVFFELLAVCDDTTLLKRGGAEGRLYAQEKARGFLANGGVRQLSWESEAIRIHRSFVARNLTAGGVADLLAATLFIHGQGESS